jgi:hypothetical protein
MWGGLSPASQGGLGPPGLGLSAFVTLFGLGYAAPLLIPAVVLTTHTLRRARVFQGARVTPLEEITGIGLVYQRVAGTPAPQGWFLYLWSTGDIPRRLGIGYQPVRWLRPADKVRQKFLAVDPNPAERGRPFDRYHFSYSFNPVTQTDPEKIASTYAGRVAREIYDHVLTYQGPSGLLASRQDQKHVPVPIYISTSTLYALPVQTAYWSPDGTLGHFTAAPPPQARARSASRPPRRSRPSLLLRIQHGAQLARRGRQRRSSDSGTFW